MFRNYLVVAIRNLLRHRIYSSINVLGLAIGMACCIVISLFVRFELDWDTNHQLAERIFRMNIRSGDRWHATAPDPLGPLMLQTFPEIETFVRTIQDGGKLTRYGEKRFYESILYADKAIFDVFDFPFVAGDPGTALEDPRSMVITEETARKYFGKLSPMGETLVVGDREYRISGVVADIPDNSSVQFDFLGPHSALEGIRSDLDSWCCANFETYLVLTKGQKPDRLEQALADLMLGRAGDKDRRFLNELELQRLSDIHLSVEGRIGYVYAFTIIAVFILTIACINFMNLATARAAGRAREVGLRKVIGAYRYQLAVQFLGEALITTLIALPLSVALIEVSLPYLNALAGARVEIDYGSDADLLLGLVGVSLLVGLIAGSYPAAYLSSFQPSHVLKGEVSAGTTASRLRKLLVVVQFTVSIVLIIGTAVVFRQIHYMRMKDLGLNKEHVLVIHRLESAMPYQVDSSSQRYDTFKQELLKHPGVLGATVSSAIPVGRGIGRWAFRREDEPSTQAIASYIIDENFLDVLDIEVIAGRRLMVSRASDVKGAFVINETAMRDRLGVQDPNDALGVRVKWTGNWGAVVGVVEDFHFDSLEKELRPLVLTLNHNYRQWGSTFILTRVDAGQMDHVMSHLRTTWSNLASGHPLVYTFLDEDFGRLYRNEERLGTLIGIFALLAVFVGTLGLFGLAAFAAQQRTKEIGIRKVLGASEFSLIWLLSNEFIILVLLANLIAWPLAYTVMDRWLQNFAYHTDLGIFTFVLSGILALGIALATVSYQTFKAARMNPVDALRYE